MKDKTVSATMNYNAGGEIKSEGVPLTSTEQDLWCLLDDIDTASDMFKPEQTNFYKYVMKKVKERFNHISSDGYKLFKEEK